MPLSAERKIELAEKVQKARSAGKDPERIKLFVSAFRQKYDNEGAQPIDMAVEGAKTIFPTAWKAAETKETAKVNIPIPSVGAHGMQKSVGIPIPKSVEVGGKAILDAIGFGDRQIGAAVGRGQNGMDPISRMQDPEASIVKPERDKLMASGAHPIVKLAGAAALGFAEPSSIIGGLGGAAKSAKAAMEANRAAKSSAAARVVATDEVKALADLGGRAGKHSGGVEGIPLTKKEQAAIGGVPADLDIDKVVKAEADIKDRHRKIWQQVHDEQDQILKGRAEDIKRKHGMSDAAPVAEQERSFADNLLAHLDQHSDKMKATYNKIEAAANPRPLTDNEILYDAMNTMDNLGFYEVKTTERWLGPGKFAKEPVFERTKEISKTHTVHGAELATESKKLPDQHVGFDVNTTEMVPGSKKLPDQSVSYDVTTTERVPSGRKVYGAKVDSDDNPMGGPTKMQSTTHREHATVPGQSIDTETPVTRTDRKTATVPGQTIETEVVKPKDYHYKVVDVLKQRVRREMDWAGEHSDRVAKGVTRARKAIYDNPTYSGLKQARTEIQAIKRDFRANPTPPPAPGDWALLDELDDKLSMAMEAQIKATGDQKLVDEWMQVDKLYAQKPTVRKLQKLLEGKSPDEVVRRLMQNPNTDNLDFIQSIKEMERVGAIPDGASRQLKTVAYNRIINNATKNGVIDDAALLSEIKKIRPERYNELFDGELADDMHQLVLDAVATHFARRKDFPVGSPNAIVQEMKKVGGQAALMALFYKGTGAFLLTKGLRAGAAYMAERSPKAASDYIRSVDQESLTAALFRGGLTGSAAPAALGAGRTLAQEPPEQAPTRR